MMVLSICMLSLGMWFSGIINWLTSVCWNIIVGQKFYETQRRINEKTRLKKIEKR